MKKKTTYLYFRPVGGERCEVFERLGGEVRAQICRHLLKSAKVAGVGRERAVVLRLILRSRVLTEHVEGVIGPLGDRFDLDPVSRFESDMVN